MPDPEWIEIGLLIVSYVLGVLTDNHSIKRRKQ